MCIRDRTKPVDEEEMILRIRALLRRAQIVSDHKITLGKVVLDYDALTVTREGEVQTLPRKEFYPVSYTHLDASRLSRL